MSPPKSPSSRTFQAMASAHRLEHFAVAQAAAGQQPEAGGNLRRAEELARLRDHAVDRSATIRFFRISPSPDWLDDIDPLASTKPRNAVRRQVVHHVLRPREVGAALGRRAVLPALVARQPLAAPFRDVERGLARMKSAFRSGLLVVVESVVVGDPGPPCRGWPSSRGKPPRRVVRLLPVDADVGLRLAAVPVPARVGADEPDRLHEHADEPQQGW